MREPTNMKICFRCNQPQTPENSYLNAKGYYYSYCRSCFSEYHKELLQRRKTDGLTSTQRRSQGAKRAAAYMKIVYGRDYIVERGSKGGSAKVPKGFAISGKASEAGKLGTEARRAKKA